MLTGGVTSEVVGGRKEGRAAALVFALDRA
jgi:hypothetical protein